MYCKFFGFKESPFNITPDPRFIFLSKNHKEAFAHLLYGIQQHSGFIEIIGEVGSGKTTVLRALLNQLDEDKYRTALIFNPCLSANELLASINREYGLPADNLSTALLLDELNRFLLRENAAARTVVLVIDEAQNLAPQVLEQIRLISNLETESDKLIQIVLAGQPELARVLGDPQLRQLAQRITVRYQLLPMDFSDTCAYINHRMELAGGWRAATFEEAALKRIFSHSGGLPRLINVVCDRALLIGFTEESRTISARMTADAIRETTGGRVQKITPRFWLKPAAIASGLCILAGAAFYTLKPGDGKIQPPPQKISAPKPQAAPSPVARKAAPPSAELINAVGGAQQKLSETESALQAFNAIGELWDIKPIRLKGQFSEKKLGKAAARRGLQLTTFSGTFEQLVQSDLPAMLRITIPGVTGDRYLAVTGIEDSRITVQPPLPAPYSSLTVDQLLGFWSGKGYLIWKNFLDISPIHLPETKGEHVRLLQLLLQKSGNYGGRLNGIFDEGTIEALKAFQAARGTTTDGKVTNETLLLLYRNAGGFSMPGLKQKGPRQPA